MNNYEHNFRQERDKNNQHKNMIIFCNEDMIANIVLNYLLPFLSNRNFKINIFLSQKVSRKAESQVEKLSKFNFLTKDYIRNIVFPCIEKNLGNKKCHLMTFNQLARQYECELYRIKSTKNREEQEKILAIYQEHEPYISLSVRNNLIISSEIIKVASEYGVGKIFNIHSSKLPERAGVWCSLWDMAEGKSLYGTLHIVEEGIDTGSIIGAYSVDLNKNYSYLKNLCLIYKKGAQIFLEYIDELAQGYSFPFSWEGKQDLSKRTYYRTPTYQEVNQMEDLGIELFSYSEIFEILAYYFL
ncbi:MAG: hypothetical protein F6K50_31995 [Moorea sp. SIO3I7]|nr:hypothetical protein [Moorena sp. SIO3I7]